MTTAAQQNAMMLASLVGVSEEEAGERLARTVLFTAEPGWKAEWAAEAAAIAGRTVSVAADADGAAPDLEILVGDAAPRSGARRLHVEIGASGCVVAEQPVAATRGEPHGLPAQAAACAAAAAAIHAALGGTGLPDLRLPLRLDFAQLGIPEGSLDRPVFLNGALMAGAGAVAHGFLRALRHLDVRGELPIVDPKTVQGGVLNRCLYLTDEDVGADKAVALAIRAQGDLPHLRLIPEVTDFKSAVKALGQPPETVFVTVDSRLVRRSIQLEAPHRVVDASTTDVRQVVTHSNTLPTRHACLACIYRHVPDEYARERSIADGLGVTLADVRTGFITRDSARRIAATHSSIDPGAIEGLAFDSLFRQLCGAQALATPEGRQVLAPFAFVSAWAGVLMAVETLRAFAGDQSTNYWSVDPWNTPVARSRMLRPRHPECQFCSKPETDAVVEALWGSRKRGAARAA